MLQLLRAAPAPQEASGDSNLMLRVGKVACDLKVKAIVENRTEKATEFTKWPSITIHHLLTGEERGLDSGQMQGLVH